MVMHCELNMYQTRQQHDLADWDYCGGEMLGSDSQLDPDIQVPWQSHKNALADTCHPYALI